MSDLERFVELYKSFGIDCKVTNSEMIGEENCKIIHLCNGTYRGQCNMPTLSEKFDGYQGFFTTVTFDKNGKFFSQGFYE